MGGGVIGKQCMHGTPRQGTLNKSGPTNPWTDELVNAAPLLSASTTTVPLLPRATRGCEASVTYGFVFSGYLHIQDQCRGHLGPTTTHDSCHGNATTHEHIWKNSMASVASTMKLPGAFSRNAPGLLGAGAFAFWHHSGCQLSHHHGDDGTRLPEPVTGSSGQSNSSTICGLDDASSSLSRCSTVPLGASRQPFVASCEGAAAWPHRRPRVHEVPCAWRVLLTMCRHPHADVLPSSSQTV